MNTVMYAQKKTEELGIQSGHEQVSQSWGTTPFRTLAEVLDLILPACSGLLLDRHLSKEMTGYDARPFGRWPEFNLRG